jgi:hypothetical protein
LTGQWGTQGPNLYLLVRLHVRPTAAPDDLLAEYFSSFGAAGGAVKAYFDYWESYLKASRPRLVAAFEDRGASRWRSFAKVEHRVFPPDCFGPAADLLQRAAQAVAGDRDAAARVEFLRLGLVHAELCGRVAERLSLADPAVTPERGKEALRELLAFRRTHERTWISNLNHCAWVEEQSWKLSPETKQSPDLYP